jgi:hypothetical protein
LKKYILPKSADQIKTLFFRGVKRFTSRKNARTNMTAGKVSETGFLYLCLLKMTEELVGIEERPIPKIIPKLCNGIVNFIRLSSLSMPHGVFMNILISMAR